MTSLPQTIGFLTSLALIPNSIYSETSISKNLNDDPCFKIESQIYVDVAVLNLATIFNDADEKAKAEQRLREATQKYSKEGCGLVEFSTVRNHCEVKFYPAK